jgi:hypothetical protein
VLKAAIVGWSNTIARWYRLTTARERVVLPPVSSETAHASSRIDQMRPDGFGDLGSFDVGLGVDRVGRNNVVELGRLTVSLSASQLIQVKKSKDSACRIRVASVGE